MPDTPPWKSTPLRTLAAEADKEVLWDAADAAAQEHEGDVRAYVNAEDAAMRRARLRAGAAGPLAGLPFGAKDVFDTAELPTEYGSPIYAGNQPAADAVVVARLKAAGGALYAKTVTTEFASFHPGPTRNPHNLDHSPGGSSSGSAAAVAAGMLPFAIGTQTGGSVIRPAAFCGVVGFKPTFDLLPTPGTKAFAWTLDTIGVFTNRVADAGFVVEAVTGRRFDAAVPGKELRIGICRTPMADDMDDEMAEAFDFAARHLTDYGFAVSNLELPDIFAKAHKAHDVINDYEGALSLSHEWFAHRDRISDRLKAIIEAGIAYDTATYDAARQTMKAARLALTRIWNGLDVIVAPSAPGAAPHGIETTGSSVMNRLWTAMGVPCVNIPGMVSRGGLPLGIQVIGPAMSDARTIAAAEAVEAAFRPH